MISLWSVYPFFFSRSLLSGLMATKMLLDKIMFLQRFHITTFFLHVEQPTFFLLAFLKSSFLIKSFVEFLASNYSDSSAQIMKV